MEKNKSELIDSYFNRHQEKSCAIKSEQSCLPSRAVLAVAFAGMLLETGAASAALSSSSSSSSSSPIAREWTAGRGTSSWSSSWSSSSSSWSSSSSSLPRF